MRLCSIAKAPLVVVLAGLPLAAAPTQLLCDAVADPAQIRTEGIAEKVGVVHLVCTGTPGGTVTSDFSVTLSAAVSNKITGEFIDATLVADTDLGERNVGGNPFLLGRNTLYFTRFEFNVPSSGRTTIRLNNVRVDPNLSETTVTAFLSTSGPASIGIRNNPVTVAVPRRGLLANGSSARIVCQGSRLPDESINFLGLVLARTAFVTTRVTEGSPTAFEPRLPNTSSGTRVMIRYSGFPAQARLFVPELITGSTAFTPTSAGDLGLPAHPGRYLSNSLLLSRVSGHDSSGAGGFPVAPTAYATPIDLGSVAEIPLTNGAGEAVFEVVDSVASEFESAQIPTWVYLPANTGLDGVVATSQVTFAPMSTVGGASPTAPVPRFRNVPPPADCNVARDCNASYFPRLFVDPPSQPLNVQLPSAPGFYQRFFRVLNERGGIMPWTATIAYRNGSGWLKIFPESGINNASLNLSYFPERLQPGYYEATLTIDAGPLAGSRTFAIALTVTPGPPAGNPVPDPNPQPAPATAPRYWTIGNAAQLGVSTLVPGSLAAIEGTRLNGQSVSVTLDGIESIVVSRSESKLTVIVPAGLGLRQTARLQVTVDGARGEEVIVPLAVAAPAIFPGAIYNQDGFPNRPDSPERAGNVLQIFATGLPLPNFGSITARIHDRDIASPLFAGAAPGTPGAQQVNLLIPEDLPAMTTEVKVCGVPVTNLRDAICSQPATVTLR